MTAQLTCPHCQSPLKTNKPMPAGLEVNCPKCKAPFKVPAGGVKPKAVAAATAAGRSKDSVSTAEAVSRRPSNPLAFGDDRERPRKPADRGFQIVALAIALLLFVAVLAAIIWALNDNSENGNVAEGTGPDKKTVKEDVPIINHQGREAPRPDPRIAVVKPAIDKGVKYLKDSVMNPDLLKKESTDRDRMGDQVVAGVAALIGLTLLETGTKVDDPAIKRVTEVIESYAQTMDKNYVLSTSLFFLNRRNEIEKLDPKLQKLARTLALRIIAGQFPNGAWSYHGVILPEDKENELLKLLAEHKFTPAGNAGAHGKRHEFHFGNYCLSNTQFAMLALWGARVHGIEVRDTLLKTVDFFNANQFKDGHWEYDESKSYPFNASSTAAGLLALAIEKALLNDKEFVKTPAGAKLAGKKHADLDLAFEYLGKSVGLQPTEPKKTKGGPESFKGTIFAADAFGDLYFLWCVERVGLIYGREKFGKNQIDWYDWGYPIVMQRQKADGSWSDRHGPLVDTCFALLFLKRANIAKDLKDKLELLTMMGPPGQLAIIPVRG